MEAENSKGRAADGLTWEYFVPSLPESFEDPKRGSLVGGSQVALPPHPRHRGRAFHRGPPPRDHVGVLIEERPGASGRRLLEE
jgi:hypothetical protein